MIFAIAIKRKIVKNMYINNMLLWCALFKLNGGICELRRRHFRLVSFCVLISFTATEGQRKKTAKLMICG